jgi:hypothetical protein
VAIELLETHLYKVDGRQLPGVTSVLKGAGVLKGWGTEEDLERGKQVHRTIKFFFDGTLHPEQPEWLRPYIQGLEKFVAEVGFIPTEWETPLADAGLGYAGTPDVFGFKRGSNLPVITDFKTGKVEKWTAIQLAAYVALKKNTIPYHRMGVSLPGDGSYDCRLFTIGSLNWHLEVFRACLKIERFKNE